MGGDYARLERLNADRHAALLFRVFQGDDSIWDYMPVGPFSYAAQYHRWARGAEQDQATIYYAIIDVQSGTVGGVASYLRNDPINGVIEVGNIAFSRVLQLSRAVSEAMFLMMDWAFGAGYRRFEWKCNALNRPSRRAAQRLGFSFEGVFRQHMVVKGRNRDTAWFAIIDQDWPALREAFRTWLDPANFDDQGCQVERLSDLTRLISPQRDPSL